MESKSVKILLYCFFLLLCLPHHLGAAGKSTAVFAPCNRSIADCEEENELLMESEISRRILEASRQSISYGAMKPDQPACNSGGRGEPYSTNENCLPPPSNPGSRECSEYYRCKRDG
ncbi:hypothetical protein Ancab_014008 [Ancistrocladus abbreviatus]